MIPEPTTTQEYDLFASASEPAVKSYDLFGMVEINAWACALVKGQGKVPFDPQNSSHKRYTAIDVFIQPLAEMDVKYPKTLEEHWVAEFPEWAKITLPSIKAAGFDNVREINGKWARVARVPNGKKYEKKDRQTGELTGEFADETTFKFIQFFGSEDECRAAFLGNGGQPLTNTPVEIPVNGNDDKSTQYKFLQAVVKNAIADKTSVDDVKVELRKLLNQYPTITKYYTEESPETLELINKGILPF